MTTRNLSAPAKYPRTVLVPLVLLALAAAGVGARSHLAGNPAVRSADDSPEACIARLLAAEKACDVRAYLDCFDTTQCDKFRVAWKDAPRSRVAGELRAACDGLAGQALTNMEFADADHVSLVLERIHKDHTARQKIVLCRESQKWRIAELAPLDWHAPAIPYGTPVSVSR
jgi:hypothetical protein